MTALTCYRTDRSGLVNFLNLPAADSNDDEGRTGISTVLLDTALNTCVTITGL